MGERRRGRELALQALYQMQLTGREATTAGDLWSHFGEEEGVQVFAAELVRGVSEHRERIDQVIAASCEHWRLERLSSVDLNILRIAAYELLVRREAPANVVIDEAIEIAKRFGTKDSATFVNGVLDHIASSAATTDGGTL